MGKSLLSAARREAAFAEGSLCCPSGEFGVGGGAVGVRQAVPVRGGSKMMRKWAWGIRRLRVRIWACRGRFSIHVSVVSKPLRKTCPCIAEAGDGDALGFGQEADDAPGMELGSVVRHG